MGSNSSSAPRLRSDSAADPIKQAQFQELYDIAGNYLEHFEFILESQQNNDDPRQVLKVLKANCHTAREQISKLPSKQNRRKYSSVSEPPKINRPKRSVSTSKIQINIKKYKKRKPAKKKE